MTKPMYRSAAASDPGHVRGNNEDRVYCDDDKGIYLVIDGVGGEAGGERAAAIAEGELLARLERSTGAIEDRIREGIALAGKRIYEQARRNPELAGMACVLTVAVVSDGQAVVGHVGDTRLYKIRRGGIAKVTTDHSPIGAREEAGEISEIEAMHHPRRNEIFRDVGSEERRPDDADFIEVRRIPVEPDSALLLCSDGLTDQVSSAEIMETVARNAGDPAAITRELIRQANEAGGKDNVSVVYVEGPAFAPVEKKEARLERAKPSRRAVALALLAGLITGAAATYGVLQYLERTAPPARRILTVAADGKGEYSSIQDALAAARAGDTVEVLAGVYREQVTMKDGVHLAARPAGQAAIEPRADASRPGAALIVENARSGSVSGLRVAGAEGTGLTVGVLVANSSVELTDLEVEGAASAGIVVRGASQGVVRGCWIHNNPGAGVLVEDGAAPHLAANVIANNGNAEAPRAGVEVAAGARAVLKGNVLANNARNLSWAGAAASEDAEIRKQNVFVEPVRPAPRGRRR